MLGWAIHGEFASNWKPLWPRTKYHGRCSDASKRDQRNRQREVADIAVAAREERQQDRARQRQEDDDGEDVVVDEVHRNPLHTMKAITAAAPTRHPARVGADVAGLHVAQRVGSFLRAGRAAVDRAIDQAA